MKQPTPNDVILSLFCSLLLLSSPAHLNKLTPPTPQHHHHHMSRFTTFSYFPTPPPHPFHHQWTGSCEGERSRNILLFFFSTQTQFYIFTFTCAHNHKTMKTHSPLITFLILPCFHTHIPKYMITIFLGADWHLPTRMRVSLQPSLCCMTLFSDSLD